jgi:hypothetical protein
VFSSAVVEHLDVVHDIPFGLVPGLIIREEHPLGLQGPEEALGDRILSQQSPFLLMLLSAP